MGCRDGWYIQGLRDSGLSVLGVDGTPFLAEKYNLPIIEYDLTIPIMGADYKNFSVLCFNVGENIPRIFVDIFLDNITQCAHELIVSWAHPGQGGFKHVNERDDDWVTEQVEKRGMKLNKSRTDSIREAVKDSDCPWFGENLLVFGVRRI
jgi:hypothetical protein